jgi:UDP-N-acetylmuramoyl-L-alanyl-D-glutamate--2,6-diaminopimelate ligase
MRPITPQSRSLSQIIRFLDIKDIEDIEGIEQEVLEVSISGISSNSQGIHPGDLFIAQAGVNAHSTHGAQFAESAIVAGAVAIISDGKGEFKSAAVPVITFPDIANVTGELTSWFYNHPSRAMFTVGITGTNGKTTTTSILYQLWKLANRSAASLGTLGTLIDGEHCAGTHTTPFAADLQSTLAAIVERGVTHTAMEVSSHSLVQDRVRGTRFSVVGFSNLSQDHLDFHGDMESYYSAKAKLFNLSYADRAVINVDDEYGLRLTNEISIPFSTLSRTNPKAQWSYANYQPIHNGFEVSIRGEGGILIEGEFPLVGEHNLDNALMAIAIAVESGVDPLLIAARLRELKAIPGRMESINLGQEFTAIVDFAHSPDSVEKILRSLKKTTTGKVIAVLGCGGDRDATKRPIMGKLLYDLADIAIYTSDNPRSEDPLEILSEMTAGVTLDSHCHIEAERSAAIALAVNYAEAGDCVLILGKGHEVGQEIAGVKHPFDDRIELARAIEDRK